MSVSRIARGAGEGAVVHLAQRWSGQRKRSVVSVWTEAFRFSGYSVAD